LKWTVGRNVQIDVRWGADDAIRSRSFAAELVALRPDVILTTASPATAAAQEATRTVPIVFVNVTDPVGAGYVASLARPGGNVTGFTTFEYGMSGKWLELMREIAPGVARVAIMRDPRLPVGIGQLGAIQSVAASLKMETSPIDVRDPAEITRDLGNFARAPNGGLVVAASPGALIHRKLIIDMAARYKLPAIYFQKEFVREGGLISYGPDVIAQYRNAAAYVDRVLKGASPADLPVQAPVKYELVVNVGCARELGLSIPSMLLGRADEVIE
jgi:ABC-type uncharacterized transport system substrate-binding protein